MMSVDIFKSVIIKRSGYVLSKGTLRTEDLLRAGKDLIDEYNLLGSGSKFYDDLVGMIELGDFESETANFILHEDLFNFFDSISVGNYYFGSHEGDGSLLGWFEREVDY